MEQTDLLKEEITMTEREANMKALLLIFPIMTLILTPYLALHLDSFTTESTKAWLDTWGGWKGIISMLAILISGIIAHELIHGITFALFAREGFRSIRFGILMKSMTPYCHCKEPLTATQYRISTIMPAIVLGIIPALIGIYNGSAGLLLFGLFFTIAAGGDFLILYLLRKQPTNVLIQDHPEKIGCFVFKNV
ncbi:MAG TPA: DUF3267 domain-containing protein [Chryseosolibacter sp.]|nr:DUF3267 domain-containing protein [Chryseosolibacter sp.]